MIKLKDIIKSAGVGIIIGIFFFVIAGTVIDIINKGELIFSNYSFTKEFIASIMVGIGFGAPSVVYKTDRLPMALKVIIHMGIGLLIYFLASLLAGWIPLEAGPTAIILTVIGEIVASFIVWAVFYAYNKKLAAKMNSALKKK